MRNFVTKSDNFGLVGKSARKLLSTTALTAAGLMAFSGMSLAADDWSDHQVIDGSTSTQVDLGNSTTNITQYTATVKAQGDGDIKTGWTVNLAQPSTSSKYVLYDIENDPTYIQGALNANGQVYIFDQNGVIFSDTSQVDVGSIVAAGGTASYEDVIAGKFDITNVDGDVAVAAGATMNVAAGGLAALVGQQVSNAGLINAKMGKVALASGDAVTIDMTGGLFEVAVEGDNAGGYIENSGDIIAEGGEVLVTASAAKDAVDNVINMDGVVDVSSVSVQGGKIVLSSSGGTAKISGKLDASGTEGGEIVVDAENTVATETSEIVADATAEDGEAGDITLWGRKNAIYAGLVSAQGDNGFIETSGGNLGVWGDVMIGAGGQWLLDPTKITIVGSGGDATPALDDFTFSPDDSANDSIFWTHVSNINNALNNDADVTLQTNPNGSHVGDIQLRSDAHILKTSAGDSTLSLQGHQDVIIDGSINATGDGKLNVELIADYDGSGGFAEVYVNNTVHTNGGFFNATAANDINIYDAVTTNGGDVNIHAKGLGGTDAIFSIFSGGSIDTTNSSDVEGNVTITAVDVYLNESTGTKINTADGGSISDGVVTIKRSTDGTIGLGDAAGDMQLSQGELAAIDAMDLVIGDDDHTSKITVENVDTTTATISDMVTLITGNVNGSGSEDIEFMGINIFNALTVNADDDIILADNARIETKKGAANFNGDENDGSIGDFIMGDNSLVVTGTDNANGADVNIDALSVLMEDYSEIRSGGGDVNITTSDEFGGGTVTIETGAYIDATNAADTVGGDIIIRNEDIFSSDDPNTLRTLAGGKIEVNQFEGGLLQNVIDAMSNLGNGQNKLFAYAGTYNENLTINQANLKLDGLVQAVVDGPDVSVGGMPAVVISGNGTDPVISVEAANFNLDPVVVDGNGADYGLVADGVGADGLVVDGNVFRDTMEAGIYLAHTGNSTGLIQGNTFEGDATRGIEAGTLGGGYLLDIMNNYIGANGDRVNNGILFGAINDATVNIRGGEIRSEELSGGPVDGDGVHFAQGLNSGATVNFYSIIIDSDSDEAIDFQGAIDNGALANIESGDFRGGNNGIEFANIAGTASIGKAGDKFLVNVDGQGADKRGVNLLGSITGTLNIVKSKIYGKDDAIGSNDDQNNTVNGRVKIEDSILVAESGDGVELGAVDNSNVQILNNEIYSGDNGVHFVDGVNNSYVGIEGNTVFAENNGILFGAGSPSVSDSYVGISGNEIKSEGHGVLFEGDVDTESSVNIAANDIQNKDVGINILRSPESAYGVEATANDPVASADGIHFAGHIDDASVSISSNTIVATDDGVETNGIGNGSNFSISGSSITAGDNGVEFNTGSPSIKNSTVSVVYNTINADNDGIYVDGDIDNSNFTAKKNTINAGWDGIDIDRILNGSTVWLGGLGYYDGNNITAYNGNGIEIDDGIFGYNTDVFIKKNTISAPRGNGISIRNDDGSLGVSGADLYISYNKIGSESGDSIGDDGIEFKESLAGMAFIKIEGNEIGAFGNAVGDDAIDVDTDISGGATLKIVNNPNMTARDNGIEFDGDISGNGTSVEISGNNHGIHAGDHGIYFDNDIWGGATVTINDNIISANENSNGRGDGIRFNGDIWTADINIGDGSSYDYFADPSNIIQGVDGIRFKGKIRTGADIEIDGNHLGYYKDIWGNKSASTLLDDGIEFDQDIMDQASIKITDNRINASDDGVKFNKKITDDARVKIGGYRDGNKVYAGGDGFQFAGDIDKHSLLEISYNWVDADENAVEFNGETSNHIHSGHDEEILIKKNRLVGGQNGIIFEGKASNERHDIVIRDNELIKGERGHGISHVGDIKDAELFILDNEEIYGDDDGIHIVGRFYDDAKIKIAGNEDVKGDDDDGIHVEDTGNDEGVDLDILDNHVHWTGEDGIFVKNIEDADIEDNRIHNTGRHGIYGSNVDGVDIEDNILWNIGATGIKVNPSDYVRIVDNQIGGYIYGDWKWGADDNGILVEDGWDVLIKDNTIKNVGEDGIRVEDNGKVRIYGNYLYNIYDDGIEVRDAYNNSRRTTAVKVKGNTVKNTDTGNGIWITGFDDAEVEGNKVYDTDKTGIQIEYGDKATVKGNTVEEAGRDGIEVSSVDISTIKGNTVTDAYIDGIQVKDFYKTWIGYNTVSNTGDDGIEAQNGSYVTIVGNTVSHAGFYDGDEDYGKKALFYGKGYDDHRDHDGEGANGILVKNVGGFGLMAEQQAFLGQGHGQHDYYNIEITDNHVAFAKDDGIEVDNSDAYYDGPIFDIPLKDTIVAEDFNAKKGYFGPYGNALIEGNDVGHVNDDGILVENVANSYIKWNGVSMTGGDGISVDGGHSTKVKWNRIMLAGDEGIDIENVGNQQLQMIQAESNAFIDYDWAVEVEGNEIAFTASHGIEVSDSGATKIADNDIMYTGMGEDLTDMIDYINGIASGAFIPSFNIEAQAFDGYGGYPSFTWDWGNGDGINTRDIYGYGPFGLSQLIDNNTISMTGGDGIDTRYAGRTLIQRNDISYAGIDETKFGGFYSLGQMLSEGPFDDASRESLWWDRDTWWPLAWQEPMNDIIRDYLPTPKKIKFDSRRHSDHDGIHAENIYAESYFNGYFGNTIAAEEFGNGYYGGGEFYYGQYGPLGEYSLIIFNNDVTKTADDGIEVVGQQGDWLYGTGRTLIANNDVSHVGVKSEERVWRHGYFGGGYNSGIAAQEFGYYGYWDTETRYGNGDRYGADAIHVRGVFDDNGSYLSGFSGDSFYGYDVNVINNEIDTTSDDGIEVINSGSVYAYYNDIYNIGVGNDGYEGYRGYRGADWYGADGIHVRDVFGGNFFPDTAITSEDVYIEPWSVVIKDNYINHTQDDGIEVVHSGRTWIDGNEIYNVGVGASTDGPVVSYDGENKDRYGADAIHVREVVQPYFIRRADVQALEFGNDYTESLSVKITGNKIGHEPDESMMEVMELLPGEDPYSYIAGAADDGIQVLWSGNTLIDENDIANVGIGDGEFYNPKLVDKWGADGIHVLTGYFHKGLPEYDDYHGDAQRFGYYHPYFLSTNVEITNNNIVNSADDGVEVEGVTNLLVDTNTIDQSGHNGIKVVGYAGFFDQFFEDEETDGDLEAVNLQFGIDQELPSFEAIITNNVVTNSGTEFPTEVEDELVAESFRRGRNRGFEREFGGNGIHLDNLDYSLVDSNTVINSVENALYVSGPFNEETQVFNNTFDGYDVGAHFESGLIDLVNGPGNRFLGGNIDLLFKPFDFGDEDAQLTTSKEVYKWPYFSFPEVPETGFADMSLIDDDTSPLDVDFGGSIGAQFFNGESPLFIVLDNQAFWNPGTPTLLNAWNSFFVLPSSSGTPSSLFPTGNPSQTFLNEIDQRIIDFADGFALGLFFFGFVPDIAQERIFNDIGDADLGEGGFSATITGPVNIPGAPQNVANISPFAGGEGEGEEGGVSPESLNAIETAAGSGESSTCWSDAVNVAGTGSVSSISAGTDFASRVSGAAKCASGAESN